MKSSWIIAKREIKSFFISPMAYIILGVFSLISGLHFLMTMQAFDMELQRAQIQAQLMRNPEAFNYLNLNTMLIGNVLNFAFFLLLFMTPGLTMRLLSEEKNQGTYELLFTSPLSTWDIIFGKFMGAMVVFLAMLATHSLFLLVMFGYGNPEAGPVASGYLGLFLGGLIFISLGLFASSLTKNQIVSFFIALFLSLALLMLGWAGGITSGNISEFFEGMSITTHFQTLNGGVIAVSTLTFFITMILLFLAATRISLESLTRK